MALIIVSQQCKYSKQLIDILNKANKKIDAEVVDIARVQQVPPELKSVPAVVLNDGKIILQGKDAFMWVEAQCSQMCGPQSGEVAAMEGGIGNGYSFISGDGLLETNKPYTHINEMEPDSDYGKGVETHADPRFQALLDARKNDTGVPQAIQRI